jgi:capsular polysaccharide export protein
MLILDPKQDYYIFWNGKKPRHLIAVQIVKLWGIEVRYMENGLLPNRLVFDAKGVNFENSIPRERAFFEEYESRGRLPLALTPRVAHNREKFKEQRVALPKRFIFIPFQVDYDSQILLYSPWIADMRDFFSLLKEVAKCSGYHFIIKEHPSSRKNYDDLHQESQKINNLSFINGYSTQELIQKSSAVMTINSTVGIESLLFKKRVIVLGDACYATEGICKRATSFKAILTILENLEEWEVEHELMESFLNYLYFDYLIPTENCPKEQFERVLLEKI